ncbi:MAG: glucokinase [Thaumarchaeota archaeon]|nr:glucokinase [Nitrososphaerota archaeon]
MSTLLAGDVGGTKTRLGLFQLHEDPKAAYVEATFPSANYPSLEAIAQEFLAQNRAAIRYASFGVAGPVIQGQAKITNLPWTVDQKAIASALGIADVNLVNDLEATATSVPHLGKSDLLTLNPAKADPHGTMAVIAPGTGLGEAFITLDGPRRHVHPSEGGHADFAPRNPSEVELLTDLMQRMDHVSYEEVCSGIGIRNIHAHYAKTNADTPRWHAEELDVEDPVPLMARAAFSEDSRCGTCAATFDTFASILGAEAGNLALKVLATGGVYIGGGIPRKTLPLFKSPSFMASFMKKGRMSQLVSRIPVQVIINPRAALLGAAHSGIEHLNSGLSEE